MGLLITVSSQSIVHEDDDDDRVTCNALVCSITLACSCMQSHHRSYAKAIACVEALRQVAIEHQLPGCFNDHLQV